MSLYLSICLFVMMTILSYGIRKKSEKEQKRQNYEMSNEKKTHDKQMKRRKKEWKENMSELIYSVECAKETTTIYIDANVITTFDRSFIGIVPKKSEKHTQTQTQAALLLLLLLSLLLIICCRTECISICICIREQKTQSSVLFAWCDTQYGTD